MYIEIEKGRVEWGENCINYAWERTSLHCPGERIIDQESCRYSSLLRTHTHRHTQFKHPAVVSLKKETVHIAFLPSALELYRFQLFHMSLLRKAYNIKAVGWLASLNPLCIQYDCRNALVVYNFISQTSSYSTNVEKLWKGRHMSI